MRCLSCNYDLSNLPENRCPECGRAFDPDDSRTFRPRSRKRRLWLFFVAMSALLYVALFAALIPVMLIGSTYYVDQALIQAAVAAAVLCPVVIGVIYLTFLIVLQAADYFLAGRFKRNDSKASPLENLRDAESRETM